MSELRQSFISVIERVDNFRNGDGVAIGTTF